MMQVPRVEGYDDPEEVLSAAEKSQVIVGIPSRNSAHTVAYVLKRVEEGILKYLKDFSAVAVVCDGLSTDGTADVVKAIRKYLRIPSYVIPNTRSAGKGGALWTLIDLAAVSGDLVSLVFVDSDSRSITPEWVALLAKGSMECGYTTPNYVKHKYDATITNFIARPLTSSAYGIDLTQPIGGDFGLGKELVVRLSRTPLWSTNPWYLRFGVDIFITHTALASGIEPCEADLKAKVHEGKDPAKGLKNMFIEVTGALFTSLIEYFDAWAGIQVSELRKPKKITEPRVPESVPEEIAVNTKLAKDAFLKTLEENKHFLTRVLGDDVVRRLTSLTIIDSGIPADLWAEVMANAFTSFAGTTRYGVRVRILEALFGLWQGRLYRYYTEVEALTHDEVKEVLENEVKAFLKVREAMVRAVRQ